MIRLFLSNHVFANLTFALVLVTGFLSYSLLPRQQDPDMNFNWISIVTLLPGASSQDVEKLLTDPLEEAIQHLPDVRFAISSSQEGSMDILVRFEEMDDRTFDKRILDLRREIQNKQQELPDEASDPVIMEITSANGWPMATVVVSGLADDENLRLQARRIKKDLERIQGVDDVLSLGLRDPEIKVQFHPGELQRFGLLPTQLADLIQARFQDISAGSVINGSGSWLLRLTGSSLDMESLASMPIPTPSGELTLGRVANVTWGRKKADQLVRFHGRPAILLSVTKRPGVNVLELTKKIRHYIEDQATLQSKTGVAPFLADDQTHTVQSALATMESNAILGLILVMVTTWIFLGVHISFLVSLGIPFALAGCFGLLYSFDQSLNVMVLLGVVIALGMLVDDAVVVVESIYVKIAQGMPSMDAGLQALQEVAAPVATSVLTTMAAFLPLMLLPGILGKFMRVIPMVVSLALAISLLEAFWMLPAHVAAMKLNLQGDGMVNRIRGKFLRKLRFHYTRLLLKVFKRPRLSMLLALIPFFLAAGILFSGMVRMDFFAADPMPFFYVNVKMPPGTPLEKTMETVQAMEQEVTKRLNPGEAHAIVGYAGQMMTETKPFFGERYGQILVSLTHQRDQRREVTAIIDAVRPGAGRIAGAENISFMPMSGGPPVTRPISVKVRGDDLETLRLAAEAVKHIIRALPEASDVTDDDEQGSVEMALSANGPAMQRVGMPPSLLPRLVRLMGDGEVAARFQHNGEKTEVRIQANPMDPFDIDQLLQTPLALPSGKVLTLGDVAHHQVRRGPNAIRHYNFRRSVTVEADLDTARMNSVEANQRLLQEWQKVKGDFPGIDLDFSGILDDINEAKDAIAVLFLFGIGLMYMILGTQFRSYFQPLLILTTVPMAFTGVVLGLLVTGQPLSLYTLYGVVALSGIAVNASIVLISAANDRKKMGMSALHAMVWAARRRVIPILITTVTTIAGLFSLAMGLGGSSLLWGPVATAIVWGLSFSATLTLFLVPLLYLIFMGKKLHKETKT